MKANEFSSATAALRHAIGPRDGEDQRIDATPVQPRQRGAERSLARGPDLLPTEGVLERALARDAESNARQRPQVVQQRPQDQRRLLPFRAQPGEDAQRALRLSCESRSSLASEPRPMP